MPSCSVSLASSAFAAFFCATIWPQGPDRTMDASAPANRSVNSSDVSTGQAVDRAVSARRSRKAKDRRSDLGKRAAEKIFGGLPDRSLLRGMLIDCRIIDVFDAVVRS